jgi:hypothetical protein
LVAYKLINFSYKKGLNTASKNQSFYGGGKIVQKKNYEVSVRRRRTQFSRARQ